VAGETAPGVVSQDVPGHGKDLNAVTVEDGKPQTGCLQDHGQRSGVHASCS